MKIMLVDDSEVLRELHCSVLPKLGYADIVEACDGRDALSKVDEAAPDLILLDRHMPNMDGMEFVRAYRKDGRTTPIIMVSTESDKARVIEAVKAGVNDYLVRPYTPEHLAERIATTMSKVA